MPGILNVSFEGVEGESLVTGLGELALSTGSACSSASGDASYVLRALGRDAQLAQSSLRFSLGRQTSREDIDRAVAQVRREVERLRAVSPAAAPGLVPETRAEAVQTVEGDPLGPITRQYFERLPGAGVIDGRPGEAGSFAREAWVRFHLAFDGSVVNPTWNAAFVYDTEAGVQAALEIFEFANSQLLQFRYYDALLDSELGRIYDSLEDPRWYHSLAGQRYVRAAQQLHALFIDVNELTDKTENALKMVGDVYAARLYTLVASRLGLDRWKQNVEEKLDTLDDIYRFTVDQTQMSRGHLLELTIILILILELVLFFMGIMK